MQGKGRKQQGVSELKANYFINAKTLILGQGAFGKVFKTTNKNDTSMKVAIKVLDKDKFKGHTDSIMDEVSIISSLDHPNIVKYYETYDDSKYTYLIMEFVRGSHLFDRITKQSNQNFDESQAAHYMR